MTSDHSSVTRAADQFSEDILVGLDRSVCARTDGTVPADLSVFVETGPEDNFGAGGVDRLFNMRPGPPQSIGITFREKF